MTTPYQDYIEEYKSEERKELARKIYGIEIVDAPAPLVDSLNWHPLVWADVEPSEPSL
jgi:hypothetical protein